MIKISLLINIVVVLYHSSTNSIENQEKKRTEQKWQKWNILNLFTRVPRLIGLCNFYVHICAFNKYRNNRIHT